MANTTRLQIPQEVSNFYDRTLLLRVVPRFVHMRWAQFRDIPRKSGSGTIKFRRYSNLAAATTPLSEGITPPGSQLAVTDITATVSQYGDFITGTDVLEYESEDAILTETASILGDQASDTMDILTRDILAAGTNVFYGGTATSTITVTNTDLIDAVVIKKVIRLMKNNKARKMLEMLNPTTGIGTTPINSSYIAVVHPNTTFDLKSLTSTGFIPVEKYASQKNVMDGEVGAMDEVRFVESTNAKVLVGAGAGGIDVYVTLVLADQAYGVTKVNGESLRNIVKALGSGNTSDPLEQRWTSGWKTTFVAKILNDAFLVRIEHAVSS
jgi:N4-gp56 family major capsid protein